MLFLNRENEGQENIIFSADHTSFASKIAAFPGRFAIGPAGNGYPNIGYNFTTTNAGGFEYIAADTAWMTGYGSASSLKHYYAATGTAGGAISWTTLSTLTNTGNLTIAGTFTEQSALRFKENVQDLEYNNIISQLKPKIYNKIGQEEQEVGLIAEDVEALDKTLVTYQEDGTVEGIKYTRLVPHLIAHIQKLEERLARIEHGNT